MARDGLVRRASPTRNRVAWNYVKDAGLRSLVKWVQEGTPPPRFAPITVNQQTEGPPVFVRGRTGNVEGGIRPPELAAATGLHKGANDQPGILRLSGESKPFGRDEMLQLHGSREGFLQTWDAAVDALFQAGLMDVPQRDVQRERGRRLWP